MSANKSLLYYERSINRTINYIFENYSRKITLDELSKVSCFSKYHFHRIFLAVAGETVGDFISRVRIEKGAYHLIYNQSASITQISFDCGFSSSQNFAKAFKSRYKMSPREYRDYTKNCLLDSDSNPGNMISNTGKSNCTVSEYFGNEESKSDVASQVKLETCKDQLVAYVRKNANYTPQIIAAAFRELHNWASPRGFITSDTTAISVYWDNVAVTPVDKRRFDACVPVETLSNLTSPVHKQILTGGLCAVYHTEIKNFEFYKHWNRFLKLWFPSSGFVPDDRPCFERIYNIFDSKNNDTLLVDICIPVKKL